MQFPKARSRDIVQQYLNDEILIYDLQTSTAYSLNNTSSVIYQACDGETSFEKIKREHQFTDDLIYFALDELNKKNLLENYSASNFAGLSRREVIRKIGLGSMVALPVIASIIAPTAASAASGLLPLQAACTAPAQCASNSCSIGLGTCCSRTSGGSADNAPCTSAADCCLAGSGCRPNGTCCRGPGRGAGNSGAGQPSLCCSGTCIDSGSLCVCT